MRRFSVQAWLGFLAVSVLCGGACSSSTAEPIAPPKDGVVDFQTDLASYALVPNADDF